MDTLSKNVRPLLACALGAVICFAASAQDPTEQSDPARQGQPQNRNSKSTTSDQSFLNEAAAGGLAEVELGQLAADRSSNPEVKKFAERMVTDHGKANDQLKEIAAQKGIDLPAEPSAKHKVTKERLSKLSGDEFDKAYMSNMLSDHKKDVAAFRKESTEGKDPQLKEFAAKALPTLEDHLKEAESISPKLRAANP
jgi:putative membrane protein